MKTALLAAVAAFTILASVSAAESLKPGDYLGVIGDSITEQRLYTVFIEDYLLMCKPFDDLELTQFGWGGVQSRPGGINNKVIRFAPSVITVCLGMNEGGYGPMTADKAERFRDQQRVTAQTLKKGGVRWVLLASPGCVDSYYFRTNNMFKGRLEQMKVEPSVMYNATLKAMGEVTRQVAAEEGCTFVDIHTPMMQVMAKAKAKYGQDYQFAGPMGIHPDRNGHMVMAYEFLKAMGCKGDIGTITFDMANDSATATAGHKVLSCGSGKIEIESSRYPFCFFGDPASNSATSGIIEFFPFNDDLNRFMLAVKGLAAGNYRLTWAASNASENAGFKPVSKEFSSGQLAAGINLAAEFLSNPFCEQFAKVEKSIHEQQSTELELIKFLLNGIPNFKRSLPEESATFDHLADAIVKKSQALREQSAAAVVPVRHVIQIERVE